MSYIEQKDQVDQDSDELKAFEKEGLTNSHIPLMDMDNIHESIYFMQSVIDSIQTPIEELFEKLLEGGNKFEFKEELKDKYTEPGMMAKRIISYGIIKVHFNSRTTWILDFLKLQHLLTHYLVTILFNFENPFITTESSSMSRDRMFYIFVKQIKEVPVRLNDLGKNLEIMHVIRSEELEHFYKRNQTKIRKLDPYDINRIYIKCSKLVKTNMSYLHSLYCEKSPDRSLDSNMIDKNEI